MIRLFAGRRVIASLIILIILSVVSPLAAQNAQQNNAQAGANLAAQQRQAQLLDQVLTAWFNSSKDIQKLEGEHRRFVFDFVFNVEKRATGRFYYESPDKGRIDLTPNKEQEGQVVAKVNPLNGEKAMLKVQPDAPQRWVCDGQQILVIDDVQKSAQQFNIPEAQQGVNIMDGPLPFLFGMPPEKAKARYEMQILSTQNGAIDIFVKPKQAVDAANYKWARVRIEQKTMLPMAVQMLDPAGTRETVYTFPRITRNPNAGLFANIKWWKEKDPFQPDLKGYDVQVAGSATLVEDSAKPDVAVPSVIGFDYQEAQKLLERAGFSVKFRKGEPAVAQQLIHHVQSQIPKPKEAAASGSTIWLTLYMPMVAQTSGEQPASKKPAVATASSAETATAAKPATGDVESIKLPRVTGLFWKDAEKILRNAECVPEFVPGKVAGQTTDIYVAYDQSPPAGTIVPKGQKVTLKVFVKPKAGSGQ
ncbi:PASTA domain-containing protein [bacterium]|nr:PASTA domain-containing protein [bacterium]